MRMLKLECQWRFVMMDAFIISAFIFVFGSGKLYPYDKNNCKDHCKSRQPRDIIIFPREINWVAGLIFFPIFYLYNEKEKKNTFHIKVCSSSLYKIHVEVLSVKRIPSAQTSTRVDQKLCLFFIKGTYVVTKQTQKSLFISSSL